MKQRLTAALALVCMFALSVFAQKIDHTSVVVKAKSDLSARGQDFTDCGSFQIVLLTAWRLHTEGAGLLDKPSGSHCEWPVGSGHFFASDIIAYPSGQIYDILVGSGDPNLTGPAWQDDGVVDASRYHPAFEVPDLPPAPSTPATPNFANVQNVSLSPTFTWTSTGATTYDVYLDQANPPTVQVASGLTAPTWTPTVPLQSGTIYNWRVVARNASGVTQGPDWAFSTVIVSPVVTPPTTTPPVPVVVQPGGKLTWKQILMIIAAIPAIIAFCASGACR